MGMQPVLTIVAIVLLLAVIVLQIVGRKKSGTGEIASLLRCAADEQRESVSRQIASGATEQFRRFDVIQESVQRALTASREEQAKQMREFGAQIDKMNADVTATLQTSRAETNEQLGKFSAQLDARLTATGEQTQKTLQTSREEQSKRLREFGEQMDSRLSGIQRGNAENIEKLNATLEAKIKSLQDSNEQRLAQMQNVVDEKLQKTLETRLAQSFELVGKQLDSVQQGLGEMKNLAADAKSLKNALMNVKERGTYGEVRLEKLLSDILVPSQYDTNVEIASGKRVEFVIKLPGNGDIPLLLPIDSKFPIEDYNRLLDAQDKPAIDEARRSLAAKIRAFAKDIRDKYIAPPKTTDFALMFLPTEGLYAEVLQNAALFEELRDRYKVTAIGATTLSAFLASLQMGFKTLAIEQRSQEVWDTLRAVKKTFGEFETVLSQAHKQLQTVDNTIEKIVGTRTRAINKALRNVEELGETDSKQPLIDFEGE
ncbi:MAG: DNA recombination protein RmuC [Clostridiales Family XIII bacterium]|jgi:DNA recombination protein RmuC|nr:DNA recombination protein RmuC [Clostridiales Family XIII bacterium]